MGGVDGELELSISRTCLPCRTGGGGGGGGGGVLTLFCKHFMVPSYFHFNFTLL